MNYYDEIKDKLIDNEIYERVKDNSKERNRVKTYFEIGKLLSEAGSKYGNSIIENYAKRLVAEVGKKYNKRTLFRMRQFYRVFSDEKVSALLTQLSWSHCLELIVLKDINEINYYIDITIKNNYNYRQLHEKIKINEYERLDEETRSKLINREQTMVSDFINNPIFIKNSYNYEKFSERDKVCYNEYGDNMDLDKINLLADKMRRNEYEVIVCSNKEEAKKIILDMCKDKSVGIGDSHSINDLNILDDLQKQNDKLYAMQLDKSRENKINSMITDIFILSANAVSFETGEMVNIDSSCNRVAPSLYGPNHVLFVIGKNKIEKDLESAIKRIKNYVAPKNSKAHNYETPCAYTGLCSNCSSKDRICRATVIYHKRPKQTPTTIILVNEELGW